MGMPGWPDLAASTASIASARIALARSRWLGSSDEPRSSVAAAVMGVRISAVSTDPARRLAPADQAGRNVTHPRQKSTRIYAEPPRSRAGQIGGSSPLAGDLLPTTLPFTPAASCKPAGALSAVTSSRELLSHAQNPRLRPID
jgi:hypothetical protein